MAERIRFLVSKTSLPKIIGYKVNNGSFRKPYLKRKQHKTQNHVFVGREGYSSALLMLKNLA